MRNRYTMTVKDMAGVLNRITGYIRRNGWNVARVLVEPIGETGKSRMALELDLTEQQAARCEQRLSDWNFVFDIQQTSGCGEGCI